MGLLRRRPLLLLAWVCPTFSQTCTHDFQADNITIALLLRLSSSGQLLDDSWKAVSCAAVLAINDANLRRGRIVSQFSSLPSGSPHLHSVVYDTDSNSQGAVPAYRDARSRGAQAIVGPARSAVSEPLAVLGSVDSVPTVSYWATATSLSSQATYPFFSRSIPSDEQSALEALRVLSSFGARFRPPQPYPVGEDHAASIRDPSRVSRAGWQYITVLHQDDVYGSGYLAVLQTNALSYGLQIYYSASYESGDTQSIRLAVSRVNGANSVGNVTSSLSLIRPELVDPCVSAVRSARLRCQTTNFQRSTISRCIPRGRSSSLLASLRTSRPSQTPPGTLASSLPGLSGSAPMGSL